MSPIGIIDAGFDMDSGYVYAKFITGDIVLIDCDEVERPTLTTCTKDPNSTTWSTTIPPRMSN